MKQCDDAIQLIKWAYAVSLHSDVRAVDMEFEGERSQWSLHLPERHIRAAWILGRTFRTVRPTLKIFVKGYYGYRSDDWHALIALLLKRMWGQEGLSREHRLWKGMEKCVIGYRIERISERRIADAMGNSLRQTSKNISALTSRLEEWEEEIIEVLDPVFREKGWFCEDFFAD